jgi:hypothetical protein
MKSSSMATTRRLVFRKPLHLRPLLGRTLVAGLVALVSLVSAPMAASWAAPPGASAPAPLVPDNRSSWATYDASRKSEGAAVAIELFLPGFGSLYGGHWQGALTTWGVSVAGFFVMAWGFTEIPPADAAEAPVTVPLAIWGGLAMMAGARVHGLVDSYRSASRYNRGLARRLGLQGDLVLTPMPLHVNGQTALGFGASWQF